MGMKGVAGNKGGIAVRFELHSFTFAFVCAHLSAGQNKVELRNADYHGRRLAGLGLGGPGDIEQGLSSD